MLTATSQIQGIEIYDMLQRQLNIERNEQDIQRQLNNVQKALEAKIELSTKDEQEKTDKALGFLAVLAIFSTLTDFLAFLQEGRSSFMEFLNGYTLGFKWWFITIILVLIIIGLAPCITDIVGYLQKPAEAIRKRIEKRAKSKGDKK